MSSLVFLPAQTSCRAARRYAPPIATDLRPCANESPVLTALVACMAAALLIPYGTATRLGQLGQTDGQTDGRLDRGIA